MKLTKLKIGLLSALLLMGCATQAEQMSQDYANHPEILNGYKSENPFYQRSFNNLVKASDWAVTDGLEYYFKNGRSTTTTRTFMNESLTGVTTIQVSIDTQSDSSFFLMNGSAGVFYGTKLVKRFEQTNDKPLYEYWVTQVNQGPARAELYQPYCKFMIARTSDVESQREIIYVSHLYFDQYTDPATGVNLKISPQDYSAMVELDAASHAQCFSAKHKEMTNYVYRMKEDGTGYERNKISWLERKTKLWF